MPPPWASLASWLSKVALGMTLVFGVMRVLGVAHEAFYALGAYTCATLVGLIAARGGPEWHGFLVIPLAAVAVSLGLRLLTESGLLRLLQCRDAGIIGAGGRQHAAACIRAPPPGTADA